MNTYELEVGGKTLTIQHGILAEQANGAVTVRQGDTVVLVTACMAEPREGIDFLPLTVDPQLSRTLGTRHRAAIGLTEENDAVAIVVSEETGHVSLALDGRIEQALGPDRLRSRLQQLLRSPRREPEAREARAV